MTSFDRRDFLKGVMGTGLAHMGPSLAWGRSSSSQLVTTSLTDTLHLIRGAGGNVVAARSSNGAVMVDGGVAQRAGELLKLVHRETSTREVHTLFNTHWHPEQTGCNERLGKLGAKIIAHENTRLWLAYANPLIGSEGTYGPLPIVARPNQTLYTASSLQLDEETLDYGYLLQAHTDGDIYVWFRQSNVLVAGDVACAEGWPIIDWRTGGWIGGMVEGLGKLVALTDAKTRIVPGRGPLLTRADLQAHHDMYATIFARLEKILRQGKGPEEAVAERPTSGFDADRGDPTLFVTLAFQSMWGHFAPDA